MLRKRIVFYWAQGEATAPEIVKRCWDAWARKNPGWDVEIHDSSDASRAFHDRGIAHPPATHQAQSDIFRVHELQVRGGVYVDAATIPVKPLDDWIEPMSAEGFFAYHDPYRRRPVESQFLVAEPRNPIMTAWLEEVVRYWQIPRRKQLSTRELDKGWEGALACRITSARLAMSGGTLKSRRRVPKDGAWSVSPNGGGVRPVFPYFWLHYLFDYMIRTRPRVRAFWSRTPKLGSYKDQVLRHWKRNYAAMTEDDLLTLVEGSRMQKLVLDELPPEPYLARLLG
ncbi:hypothetical protein HKCCSP123_02575 [Rhodobacterales bacterium HKCCSP123]|nr:hypothetical protein [Rhodobacterales bacterium HKCCSP123]